MNDKCIFSFVRGGLGNQMFIYAASRRIAIKNKAKLLLITDSFEDEPHGRNLLIGNFSIDAETVRLRDTENLYSKRNYQLARNIDRYLYPFSASYPHYSIERTKDFINRHAPVDKRILNVQTDDYLFVDGFFQHESYFSDISDIVRSDFRLRSPPGSTTTELADRICNSNSVCIHFRRTELEKGDMLKKHGKKHWMGGYKQGLDMSYYLKALEIIEDRIDAPEYYCFSDNPDWAQENVRLPFPVTHITHNNSQATCHEDLYLMSKCRHHIISHSTFGWWGAWLAENPDQRVVAPINICSRPKPPYYPDRWTTIEVCQRKAS